MTKAELKEREEIQMCLNCPLRRCIDCLGGSSNSPAARKVRRCNEVRRLAKLGYSDSRIAKAMKIPPLEVEKCLDEMRIPYWGDRKLLIICGRWPLKGDDV